MPVKWRAFWVVGACCLLTTPAMALDKQQCVDSHLQAQMERREGHLLFAESLLARCGQESCPAVVRSECATWLEEVRLEIPSLVVAITDSRGQDLTSYQLHVDDQSASLARGDTLRLDPGEHEVRIDADGYESYAQRLAVRSGERLRRIEAKLAPRGAVELGQPHRAVWPLWVLGGVAVAGVGGFAWLGLEARANERELQHCSPSCTSSAVDHVRRQYLLANLSLGAGVLATGGAVWWWLTEPARPLAIGVALSAPEATSGASVVGHF